MANSNTILLLFLLLSLNVFAQKSSAKVRLRGPYNSTDGFVEILYNGTWGTLCTEKFDIKDARVICRMLGYPGALAAVTKGLFGQGNGTIWFGDVCCHGSETSIFHCPHQEFGSPDCDHRGDVGVVCQEIEEPTPRVRLISHNGSAISSRIPSEGRVEIFLNGVWGTICDDKFDIKDAHVICKMLKFPRALAAVHRGNFGKGTDQIWLDELRCHGNESSIFSCHHGGVGMHDCGHYEDVGVMCQDNASLPEQRVRLKTFRNTSGSGNNTDGLVEILINGEWGTICDDSFDKNDADVICRMMGFPGAVMEVTRGAFGEGKGKIWLDDLRCYGNETSLFDCQHSGIGWHNCLHHEDVGVICKDKKWDAAKRVRLVGTKNSLPNEGRVEILLNEEWGTICDDLFDINDAHVICRLLGYPKAFGAITRGQFGQGTGKIWLDDLRCNGNETSLFNCPHGGIGVHNCRHYEDVGVICQPTQSMSQLKVRLVDSKNATSNITDGRVEVYLNGLWGTICDDLFDINDANVICRELGFPGALTIVTKGVFGQGTGKIWLDDLRCHGNETSLFQCPHGGLGNHNCGHNEDVGVVCRDQDLQPSARVRLVGVSNSSASQNLSEGFVELYMNGIWGTICDDYFDKTDAQVICRQLGFADAMAVFSRGNVNNKTGKIWMDDVHCKGNESSVFQCPHNGIGEHNCRHIEDAGVVCLPSQTPMLERVRLKGGKTSNEGRVEVLMVGLWGSVCNVFFQIEDARVICKMLGFPDVKHTLLWPQTNNSSNRPIWVSWSGCFGNESSIFECRNVIYRPFCHHNVNEDVGVICRTRITSIGPRNVVATGITSSSAIVLWDQPMAAERSDIAEYRVFVNGSGSNFTAVVQKSRSFVFVKNLKPSLSYSIFVETLDNYGRTAKSRATNFRTKAAAEFFSPEIVQLSVERVKTNASDNIVLVCKSTGSLPLNFTWSKEGSVLSRQTSFAPSTNLVVEANIVGSYTCQVENVAGKDSRRLLVTNESLKTLKQTQNQAPLPGKNNTTLLVFLILSLIINIALAAGILYLLRVSRQPKEISPAVELDNVKNGPLNGELGFENVLYSADEAPIVENMEQQ